jgi:hypothetical protein
VAEGDAEEWKRAYYRTVALAPLSEILDTDFKIIKDILMGNFVVSKDDEPIRTNQCRISWYVEWDKCRNSAPFFIQFKDNSGIKFSTTGDNKGSGVQGQKFGYGSYDEGGRSYHLEYELKSNLIPRFGEMGAQLDIPSTPDQASPSLLYHYEIFNFGTGTNGIQYGMLTAGQFGVSWGLFSTTTGAIPSTGWHHIYCRGVNGTYSVYVDGKLNNSGGSAGGQAFTTFGLGTTAGPATPFSVSDFRMTRNTNTPVDNIVTHYVNVTNIAGFATPGTVSTQSVASSLTFTGLATSSEVRIYTAGTTTELAGIENTDGTGIFTYNYSTGGNVDIQIYNIQYQPIRYTNFTLGASSTTIPIQQQYDRNYFNPA